MPKFKIEIVPTHLSFPFSFAKFALFVGIILSASAVLAYPKVGNRVAYRGTVSASDGSLKSVIETKEVLSYHEGTKQWLVKTKKSSPGSTSERIESLSALFTPTEAEEWLVNCEAYGGTWEQIATVAGRFDTCHMRAERRLFDMDASYETTEIWYGDVPFGHVRKIRRDLMTGKKMVLELTHVQ